MFTKKGVSRISERALYYSHINPLWAYCCSYDLADAHNVPYSTLITVHSKTMKKNQRSLTHYSIIATDIWGWFFCQCRSVLSAFHWSIAVTRLNKYATPPHQYPSLQTDQEISIKKTHLPANISTFYRCSASVLYPADIFRCIPTYGPEEFHA